MSDTTKESRIAALDTAITRAGGIMRFAQNMRVTHQAIYGWRKRGWVPADKALVIESVFGVPRADLMEPRLAAVLHAPTALADDIL